MAKALKTLVNDASVSDFLNSVEDQQKRDDSFKLIEIFQMVTGQPAKMWGSSIVGFDSYHYKSKSGQEGDWMMTGFSPRKQNLTIYIMPGFEKHQKLLQKLGNHKTSVSCLYIKKLDDVDENLLIQIIDSGYKEMLKNYPNK